MFKDLNGTAFKFIGPSDGPVVVMIHGLGLNQDCWQWTSPTLAQKYRVLTYDLYGHGLTISPPSNPSLSLFSKQLVEMLDYCNIQTAKILGFSLGGMIARRFAQDFPKKTDALIILHSPHRRTLEAQRAILKRVAQARHEGPQSTVEAALDRWFTDQFRQDNPQMMDTVRGWVTANDITTYHKAYQVLADGIDEIVAPSPPISCPTLVITGTEDHGNGPEMSQAIASEITGSRLVILPRLRHMALAEDPKAINRPLTNFLSELITTK